MKIIESKRKPHERAALNARRQFGDFFFLCAFALHLDPISSFNEWEDIRSFDSCENDFYSRCSTFFFRSSPIKKLEHWDCMDGSRSFKYNFNRTMNECLYFQFTTMANFPYGYLFITFVWVFCGNAQSLYVHYAALKSSIFVKLQKLLYHNEGDAIRNRTTMKMYSK